MIGTRRAGGGRLRYAAQWALVGMYLLGGFGVLLLAVIRSGDWGALLDPRLERLDDPKVSMTAGWDSIWNPFAFVLAIARLTAMLVVPVTTIGVLLGLSSLVVAFQARDRRGIGGSLLLIVVWVGLFALAFTPYGGRLHHWLAD
ncbi:hypothetical protein AB0G04_04685 [Actinoplanes sp. NPDC023801]|uniref:hypothetical protein n=1 Tax=Actinoplanes sp. NPDC023801 TaxID=3154595 RepID=UPI0034113C3F